MPVLSAVMVTTAPDAAALITATPFPAVTTAANLVAIFDLAVAESAATSPPVPSPFIVKSLATTVYVSAVKASICTDIMSPISYAPDRVMVSTSFTPATPALVSTVPTSPLPAVAADSETVKLPPAVSAVTVNAPVDGVPAVIRAAVLKFIPLAALAVLLARFANLTAIF